jgi:hypothetical protein
MAWVRGHYARRSRTGRRYRRSPNLAVIALVVVGVVLLVYLLTR